MNTRPALWSLALAAAVVLAGCNKHDTTDDTMQPGAGTTPATSATAPTGMTPPATSTAMMPPSSSTAMTPPSSSTASMPPPVAPPPSSTTGH